MRIVLITPGTGNFYCGVCLRDEALGKAFRQMGHEVESLPVYLPLVHESAAPEEDAESAIFFGGINAYLQQLSPLFRHSPRLLDRQLDRRGILDFAARMSEMTDPSKLGAMTLSMLEGESGRQRKELVRMIEYLRKEPPPDLICLATALQAGMIRSLRAAFPSARIACFFQGEDEFIDALSGGYAERCWKELALRSAEADRLIVPSVYFRERIAAGLRIAPDLIQVIPNGIDLEDFPEKPLPKTGNPRIGYLARMCSEKGLDTLVDAFIKLDGRNPAIKASLRVVGVMRRSDEKYLQIQKEKLAAAGLEERAEFLPNVTRAEKIAALADCSVFSVPARYSEAFGLYVVEALAAGVPCVLPEHSAFPELIENGKEGLIYRPHDSEALSTALEQALNPGDQLPEWGESAARRARKYYDIATTASSILKTCADSAGES